MNLTELHAAISKALSHVSDTTPLRGLAIELERTADMTGWATGPIDPHGRVATAFELMKVQARVRFDESQSPEMAQLHDALGDLLSAIARHDDDLNPDSVDASNED
jgi:hypothetical protein